MTPDTQAAIDRIERQTLALWTSIRELDDAFGEAFDGEGGLAALDEIRERLSVIEGLLEARTRLHVAGIGELPPDVGDATFVVARACEGTGAVVCSSVRLTAQRLVAAIEAEMKTHTRSFPVTDVARIGEHLQIGWPDETGMGPVTLVVRAYNLPWPACDVRVYHREKPSDFRLSMRTHLDARVVVRRVVEILSREDP